MIEGNPEGFARLLSFDSDSEDFVRGFEAGRLWAIASAEFGGDPVQPVDGMTMHAANAEMVLRIGEALGVRFAFEVVDDTWARLRMLP